MKKLIRSSSLVVCTGIVVLLASSLVRTHAAQLSRIHGDLETSRRIALGGHVHPLARAEYDEGSVAGSTVLQHITLQFVPTAAQQAELNALITAQQDRSSPLYHQWLTPEEFGVRFGMADADLSKVQSWLESQGFSAIEVARSRNAISFNGTAAQVQSAFHTAIHRYRISGEEHIANMSDPELPAPLVSVVSNIRGLHDFHPHAKSVPVQPRFTSYISGSHFVVPDDFQTIYDLKPLYNLGIDGTGQTIAVVGQSDVQQSDINAFRSAAGLPASTITKTQVAGGGALSTSNGDLTEASLDVEWAGAVAPKATINFVFSGDAFNSLQAAVTQKLGQIISVSYGSCEQGQAATADNLNSWAQQASAQGQTIVAASGDQGAADCEAANATVASHGSAVDLPSAVPLVTGVGGTHFNDAGNPSQYWASGNNSNQGSALQYIPETAWNTTAADKVLSASGGGVSTIFTTANPFHLVSFDVSEMAFQQGKTPDNGTARDTPDIALAADVDHDGMLICAQGSCVNGFRRADTTLNVVGGTSIGTPAFSAMVALLNQMEGSAGQGSMNKPLYALATSSTDQAIIDITAGDNMVPTSTGGSIGYSAKAGYDQVTGLGSIDAYKLVYEIAHNVLVAAPPPDFTMSVAQSVTISPNGSTTVNVQILPVNAFPGPVTISCIIGGGVPPGASSTSGELAVSGLTCTPSKTTANAADTVSVTISAGNLVTDARPAALPMPPRPWSRWGFGVSALVIGGLFVTGRKRQAGASILLVVLAAGIMVSCGGGGSSASSQGTTGSTAPSITSVTVSPSVIAGGSATTGTVNISQAAGSGGQVVNLTSGNTALVSVPASVTVPAGATSATFPITTSPSASATSVQVTGSFNGTASANITVGPVVATVVVQGVSGSTIHMTPVTVTIN